VFCRHTTGVVGGVLPMPHVQVIGTAWDQCLEDYAYTRELDRTGWAWEFLRRNEDYKRAYRMNRAGHPIATQHVSGATLYRLRRRFLSAETWGLEIFADPKKLAHNTDVFWRPNLLTYQANCTSRLQCADDSEHLSLHSFKAKRAVLAGFDHEEIVFSGSGKSATLDVVDGTFLLGERSLTFQHEGINSATRHHETMQILKYFMSSNANQSCETRRPNTKYLDYLIALDGRLASRTYHDIALVLYGADAVGSSWRDDTRGLKSKVRRAVDRGLVLMNGGYLDLL
jgi:hypothetical protein